MMYAQAFLVIIYIASCVVADVPLKNCEIPSDVLFARNDTCIDLSLCATTTICPLFALPTCGSYSSISREFVQQSISLLATMNFIA